MRRVDVSKSELEAFEVRRGDVFFTRTSETVEEIGVAAAMLDPAKDTVFSGFVLRARPTDDRLDDLFKAYCFLPSYFRKQVIARGTYTTRALTNGRSLSACMLAVPPQAEQRAIAEALSDIDTEITRTAELIAKKRYLRTGAMQRLLSGDERLPDFSVPWQKVRLDEIGTWRGGMTPSMRVSRYWKGGTFPWLSSGDVKSERLSNSGMHITEDAISEKKTTIVPSESIVIVMRSGILRRYLPVAFLERPMAINQDIKALTVYPDFHPLFIQNMIKWQGEEILKTCLKAGTTVESIDFSWLKSFELPVPSEKSEQTAIAAVLSDMDAEITALEVRLEKTKALKQGMMQALLTGRVRLPVQGEALNSLEVAHA